MKFFLLAVTLALATGTFVDFLTSLQGHHSFQRLSPEEKLLFGELVVSAENNELTEFIDRAGFSDVLKLMDHMSQSDAELFAAYLAEHSNYTHHASGHEDVINKRDEDDHQHHSALWNFLHGHSSSYVHLPAMEQATYNGLKQAAMDHSVTAYIDKVGYGAILGLIEQLDGSARDQVTMMIEGALAAEAASAASMQVVKRQGQSHEHHGNDHHSTFFNYLTSLESEYYERLPEQEKQTYHALKAAAESHTLTAYFAANGYGAFFGFMAQLDSWHANEVYAYMENALAAEAAPAA